MYRRTAFFANLTNSRSFEFLGTYSRHGFCSSSNAHSAAQVVQHLSPHPACFPKKRGPFCNTMCKANTHENTGMRQVHLLSKDNLLLVYKSMNCSGSVLRIYLKRKKIKMYSVLLKIFKAVWHRNQEFFQWTCCALRKLSVHCPMHNHLSFLRLVEAQLIIMKCYI